MDFIRHCDYMMLYVGESCDYLRSSMSYSLVFTCVQVYICEKLLHPHQCLASSQNMSALFPRLLFHFSVYFWPMFLFSLFDLRVGQKIVQILAYYCLLFMLDEY